ncbi:kynureninase [Rhodovibrionaceae bacterium A322]
MLTEEIFTNLDQADPLAKKRDLFELPEGVVYLDGNSLGPLTRMARRRLAQAVQVEWGQDLITSWNKHGWYDAPARVGAKIGKLVGAEEGSVLACDGTSINLFKLIVAAMRLRKNRRVILSDKGNFPTDLYIAQGVADLLDKPELRLVETEQLEGALNEEVALLIISHVDYRTGRLHDMKAITEKAHSVGAMVLWDLCHSAGVMSVDLADCRADLAVGCGYKYLNGGPGAPAYLYVAPRWQSVIKPPLSGWWGHDAPFAFDLDYRPADGIARNLCGTQSVLGLTALEAALQAFGGLSRKQLRAKSEKMTQLFIDLLDQECGSYGFKLASPRNPAQRGSQVSLHHPEGYAIVQALIARGVIGDFRAPDFIRLGFAPLYLRYSDIWKTVAILKEIMATQAWQDPAFQYSSQVVT